MKTSTESDTESMLNLRQQDVESLNSDQLLKLHGAITSATFYNYYKYMFYIDITTAKGNNFRLAAGGDRDDIYRYYPESCDWDEHVAAGIQSLE